VNCYAQSRLYSSIICCKANSQSNGNGKLRPPGTPKPWMYFGETRHTSWIWPNTQIHVALRQRGWSRRTRNMSHVLVCYSTWFRFTLYLVSHPPCGPIVTICTSHYVLPCKEVPFWSRVDTFLYVGSNSPKTLFWGREGETFLSQSRKILQNVKLAKQ